MLFFCDTVPSAKHYRINTWIIILEKKENYFFNNKPKLTEIAKIQICYYFNSMNTVHARKYPYP